MGMQIGVYIQKLLVSQLAPFLIALELVKLLVIENIRPFGLGMGIRIEQGLFLFHRPSLETGFVYLAIGILPFSLTSRHTGCSIFVPKNDNSFASIYEICFMRDVFFTTFGSASNNPATSFQ